MPRDVDKVELRGSSMLRSRAPGVLVVEQLLSVGRLLCVRLLSIAASMQTDV
jgi:hypothetical protein